MPTFVMSGSEEEPDLRATPLHFIAGIFDLSLPSAPLQGSATKGKATARDDGDSRLTLGTEVKKGAQAK